MQQCWTNPTQNVDGTDLMDLVSVTLHWGTVSRTYTGQQTFPTTIPGDDVCVDLGLAAGDWYVAATAEDADGNQSAYSNEILKTAAPGPSVPWMVEPPQQLNAELVEVTALVGTTGVQVRFAWTGGNEADTELQLVEYGKDTAILSGRTGTSEWGFTPPRAGLYEVRLRECVDAVCGQWYRSSDLGYIFFFNLAPASGGGIN
jgi:hypothetical protein